MVNKMWVKETSILLGVSIAAAFTVNFISPAGIELVGQWDTSKGVVTAKAKDDIVIDGLEIEEVKQVKQIFDSGNAVFVDARSRENYEDGHIPGAVSLPASRFDAHIGILLDKYSPDQPIITYCSGRNCKDSHQLAQLFLGFGFTNVKVFIDGFPGWQAEGYPIE
jgi:rhodanese-related sulfurtransferase